MEEVGGEEAPRRGGGKGLGEIADVLLRGEAEPDKTGDDERFPLVPSFGQLNSEGQKEKQLAKLFAQPHSANEKRDSSNDVSIRLIPNIDIFYQNKKKRGQSA